MGKHYFHSNYISFQENFYYKCLRYEQLIFMAYEQLIFSYGIWHKEENKTKLSKKLHE